MRRKRPTTCPVASRVPQQQPQTSGMLRPWQSLPEEKKAQMAKVIAELLWRMRPENKPAGANRHVEQAR